MAASPESPTPVHHFVAVNHHRFHDAQLVERTVLSVLEGAARLRAMRPTEGVSVTLFYQSEGLHQDLLDRLAQIDCLALVLLPAATNGAGLNAQIDIADGLGARVFYRVDADDPVQSERFVRQIQVLEDTAADVAGGGLMYANIDTGTRLPVLPPQQPEPRDYLMNCAMLHSTLAFDLAAFRKADLRYWDCRLEDKHLGLQIARAGLRLVNDTVIYGDYTLNPHARSGVMAARINLVLNLSYLRLRGRLDLVPLACVLFFASILLPAQWLRRARMSLRASLHTCEAGRITPYSECADKSDREKTALQPRG